MSLNTRLKRIILDLKEVGEDCNSCSNQSSLKEVIWLLEDLSLSEPLI